MARLDAVEVKRQGRQVNHKSGRRLACRVVICPCLGLSGYGGFVYLRSFAHAWDSPRVEDAVVPLASYQLLRW